MPQTIMPNQYDLQGGGITISYATSTIGGTPQLSFKKGRQNLAFSGDEIGTIETPIGLMVTVTIAKTLDRGFTSFSILVPTIRLSTASGKQVFHTVGITTQVKTTIAGPAKGPQQTYKTIAMRGTGRAAATLAQKAATS